MFLFLLIGILALIVLVAIGLYRKRMSSSRHQDSVSLDSKEDLLEVSFVFRNRSGKIDTPNTSDVFAEMITFQSSVGDEHSLLLRQSKQRNQSRLKLSGLIPKKGDISKVTPERSLGDTSMEESSFKVTQIPTPSISPVKALPYTPSHRSREAAQEPQLESSVESEGSKDSINLTKIPRLPLEQDKEPEDSSESDVTALEVTQIPAPRKTKGGEAATQWGWTPHHPARTQVPSGPGPDQVQQPLPQQRKPVAKMLSDTIRMRGPMKSGIEHLYQEQAPGTRRKAEVSTQQSEGPVKTLESSLAKEKVKIGRKFLMKHRAKNKKLAQQPSQAESGSESDREEGHGSRSPHPTDLTPKRLQRIRKSKVKAADRKRKLKNLSRKMNVRVKRVEEQEVDEDPHPEAQVWARSHRPGPPPSPP
ncbi:uncharacterized protein [Narcine bancroftii]|uniref:uncharacterized protein isoform X2 n=1 Tax=Narcine bancroftii TaxID=1343680 RepID=UPI00383156D4